MAKKNTRSVRIDVELELEIKDIAKKNELSFSRASKEAAKIIKGNKIKQNRILTEIKF